MDSTDGTTTSQEPIYQRLVYEMEDDVHAALPPAQTKESDAG